MKFVGIFLVIVLLHPAVATPQTTADGVRAFEASDFATAIRILRPLAEDTLREDGVAQFYMAMLYEHGHYLPMDLVRACALYFRSSGNIKGLLSDEADIRRAAIQRSLNEQESLECNLLQQLGLQHEFTPVSFALAPGHSIRLELGNAFITFRGETRQFEYAAATTAGSVFLPVRYTEVTTRAGKDPGQRHFIEFFVWDPYRRRDAPVIWGLEWRIFEVVRHELVEVHVEGLVTDAKERLPVDPRELAEIRVNDAGHAEWVVLNVPYDRTGVLESQAERPASKEQKDAREAAYARVDWTRVRDVRRVPTFAYSDADGCGNVFNFGWSDDRMEAITVGADKELLNLSAAGTFDIASKAYALNVAVHVFERPVTSWPFCTDLIAPSLRTNPKHVWKAVRGTVHIELSPPGVSAKAPFAYRATIRISEAEFVSDTGARVRQIEPITLTAIVGFMFG